MSTPANLSEQVLALPDGAGSVQSSGQTFEVRPCTGAGSYAIPIETGAGHAGITPDLALTYSTHAGAGIAGMGWSLSVAAIERRTDKGLPTFVDQEDAFIHQQDELLPLGGGYYGSRIENAFNRIRHVREGGRNFWVVTERTGARAFYGLEPDHRLHDGVARIGAWYLTRTQDANGNEVTYAYTRDAATRDVRLASIEWAGCYRVSMVYEERADPIHSFRPGFEHVQRHRLARIALEVRAGASSVFHTYRTYDLRYVQSSLTGRSLLTEVVITGINPDSSRHALPPIALGYATPEIADRTWRTLGGALPGGSLQDRNITLVRQSRGGLPDIYETTSTGHWLRDNLGNGQFGSARRVASPGQVRLEHAGTFISDMSGDGRGDLVVGGGARVYRGVVGGGWDAPYASTQAPSVDLDASDVRLADLNADGRPHALRAGVGSWTFFENLGEGRWAPGVAVPNAAPLRLDDPRVHLVDVNGDGLPDLVHVERSRVHVWPGRGAGRFGTPYELRHAPDFGQSFDPRAVTWADLTGSGQADLLYVRDGTVTICFNRAGAALSDPVTLATRRQSSHGHVEPVDLLGIGAAGLLYTDHQEQPGTWAYLDLFPAGKPDLLTRIGNGLGATTTVIYASSAKYWADDKRAGREWRTAMPAPQVVVAAVTVDDAVTGNRLGVSYHYHHGVYDGAEREFRGFALVEQIDREADPDDPLPLAQVLVRRWYHTGVNVDLRDAYTPLPEAALQDEVPALPWARRSLRGLLMREETFALDGLPRPFLVQETAYRVFPVARTPGTQHCSFAPLPTTTRSTHLERGDERRIVETTTTYDRHLGRGYGLAVEVRERAFGRRGTFASPHEIAQTADLERVTRTQYVNRDEPDGDYFAPYAPHYLVGLPARVERVGVGRTSETLLARERFFYDGEAYQGLGYPGTATRAAVTRGRLSSRLELAFTDDLLATAYPAGSGARARFGADGRYLADGTDHYRHAGRTSYDERGMVTGTLDANGNETRVEYDGAVGLFPVRLTNAAGHPTHLVRGTLPFQVAEVLDANGNTTSYRYDPCGLPSARSVQGKHDGTDWSGNPPTHPTETYAYDLATTPVRIHVQIRQQRLGATLDVFRYVDGLGRTVQERHGAEPAPDTTAVRYRVTGWQIFNHKGLVVRTYQPVFADTGAYAEGDTTTASVRTSYDPLGRVIRVDHPDGTFETTTYHPWLQVFADRNDNGAHILPTDPRYGQAVAGFRPHLDTPMRTYVDALGRVIATAQDNGTDEHVTRKVLDLADRVVAVFDPRSILAEATWTFEYDLAGRAIRKRHATALGERHALADAAGNAIWARDARGIETTRAFDVLNRPLSEHTDSGAEVKLRRLWRYEAYDESDPAFATHQARNLFGPVEEERDADGLRFFEYDVRGLATRTSHRFWSQQDADGRPWDDPSSRLWTDGERWDPAITSAERDEVDAFLALPDLTGSPTLVVETTYDSARRPTEVRHPEGMVTRYRYNAAGWMDLLEVDRGSGAGNQVIVEALAYDARGQVTFVRHGNGIETSRVYDEDLERLTHIVTRRAGAAPVLFQDLAYAYDPVGNPVEIADRLSDSTFSHNRLIPNTRTFAYDPRYRLIKATGKKHRTVTAKDPDVLVPSPDPGDYEPYAFAYAYDAVGNLTRNHEYAGGPLHYKSGRLDLFNGDDTEAGSATSPEEGNFRYDANGNTTHTPRHEALAYTHDNQVRYVNLGGGGEVRDFRHADQRVVRLIRKNGVMALTVYLGPIEYHLRRSTTSYTKLVLHLRCQDRHAQAERVLAGRDPESLDVFFHHADHLGSGHVLTGEDGDLVSQEEYFAYGRPSDRRDARNRYRFIGVERDEDTQLCMTGPRTYDPVSGRFLQGDPIAVDRPHASPFLYASAAPAGRRDPGGYADPPPPKPGRLPPKTDAEVAEQLRRRAPGPTERIGRYDVPASPDPRTPPGDPVDLGRSGYEIVDTPGPGPARSTPPADPADLGRTGYGYGDTPATPAGPSQPSSHGVPSQPDPTRTGFDIELPDQDNIVTEEVPRPTPSPSPSPVVDPRPIVNPGDVIDGDRLAREAIGEGAERLGKTVAKKLFSIVPIGGIVGEFLFAEPGQGVGTTVVRGIGSEVGYGPIDVTTVYDVGSWVYSSL